MLPQEYISWLVDQKDGVLYVKEIRKKNLAIDWLLAMDELFMFDVFRRDFPRSLGTLQPAILEGIRNGLGATKGLNDDGWRELCLWQTLRTVIKRVSNRVLFNLPLSKDTNFLKSIERISF